MSNNAKMLIVGAAIALAAVFGYQKYQDSKTDTLSISIDGNTHSIQMKKD